MTPGLSGRASCASYWPIRASSTSQVVGSIPDPDLLVRSPHASFLLHTEFVPLLTTAAHSCCRETNGVVVASGEPDVEAIAFQDAEEFLASNATPLLPHHASPPAHSRKKRPPSGRSGKEPSRGPPFDRIGRLIRQVLRCRRTSRPLMSKIRWDEWLAGDQARSMRRNGWQEQGLRGLEPVKKSFQVYSEISMWRRFICPGGGKRELASPSHSR